MIEHRCQSRVFTSFPPFILRCPDKGTYQSVESGMWYCERHMKMVAPFPYSVDPMVPRTFRTLRKAKA